MMAATNLQDEDFNDGIGEVFQRSTLDWLNQDDLVAIYDRHDAIPLPESLVPLGPEPLEEGIFLYRAIRFRDYFGWDVVHDTGRYCRSGPTVDGAEVTHTEASMVRPEGDLFCRRNHHRGAHEFCVVHYLIRPAEDDGGADEDVVDEAAEDGGVAAEDGGVDEAAEDGGEEDYTSSSDSDDVDGDPDYDPELDESEKVVTLCKRFKDRVLELKDPVRGVAPLVSAVRMVQVFATCLTALHPDCLQLCLQAKCYKAGYDGMNGIGLKRFQKTSEFHYKPYYEVGNRYNDGKISELEAVVVAQSSDLEQDKDTGLVKQAVSSLYKRNILRLTQKYLTLSLQDIANMMVQTANAKEAETHVLQMIQDGQIDALINQKDGMVRLLEDPEQYKTSEMIEVMVSVIQRTIGLSKNLLAMDESLSRDPIYLGKVGRESQRYDLEDDFDTAPLKFSIDYDDDDVVVLILAVVTLCKRFKDRVLELKDPIRGVAPLVSAVRKVQVSANCLTVLHPDCLQLCLQAKCYKAGYDEMNGIGLKRFQKTSELHYNPYYEVGNRYNDGKISELEAVVVAQSSDLEQDKDTGLVKQAVSSLYKRNILGLTHKYLTLSLQDIVNMMVQTANAKEAETHVIQMDGQIHALINQKVRLLEDPEQYKTSEMKEVMVSVIQRTIGLSKNLLAMDESLSCDPLYLGKVGRESQRYDFGDDFDTAPQKFSM
ncbi:hypothetical protein F2Q70_00006092 [Brassica cretica]|uniref:COP9 signalosome complex subunit 3 n=1 Tax=Brassica cretica TaxID=69181 RepID=A0A8S9ILQ4_BRACR|nr:hypothetical protein F2Q70_00006092 [Brassica cretica]